ncbi:transforming growth factor beta activator LRRC33-like [Pristis pectinata]|uniref:transforming growth factor beta activator LRRC33-like n=1 Tax=Pristis pectinata TaxID=685728 RepID=UPI00223CC702|nr:transforming growth factor beta activator LRRC33-like [Pristis pectinata]
MDFTGLSLSFIFSALMLLDRRSNTEASLENCKMDGTKASCQGESLDRVPANLPVRTEKLFLNENVIRAINNRSLSVYKHLHTLNLSGNQIEVIESGAFVYNRNLEDLNLKKNRIDLTYSETHLALRTLSALTRLDLSENRLNEDMTSYIVQNLTTLEYLSLARNVIMRLEPSNLEGLVNLRELNLEYNYIYEIESGTFEGLRRLTRLNLAHNHIPCIVDFSLSQVKTLNVSHNAVELFLARENEIEFQLETLDLSHNKLLFFPLLPKLNKLKSLLLADNEMSFYGDLTNDSSTEVQFIQIVGNVTNITTVNLWDEVISVSLPRLEVLDMSRNSFRYLPQGFLRGMTTLSSLQLSQNCLKTFSLMEDEHLLFLQLMDLSQNRLSSLNFSVNRLKRLNYFNTSFNKLESVPPDLFTKMPQLTTVDLSHNNVSICAYPLELEKKTLNRGCVGLANIKSLKRLYLASCALATVPDNAFVGSPLTHLDLSSNTGIRLQASTFQGVSKSLQFLFLRNNGLTSNQLDISLRVAFRHLSSLDISDNVLTSLHPALKSLPLKWLDLRKNQLPTLQQDVLKSLLHNLEGILLSNNTFDCCQLNWWITLINAKSLIIPDRSKITCNGSVRLDDLDRISHFTKVHCRVDNTVLKYFLLLLPTVVFILTVSVMVFFSLNSKMLPKYVKAKCKMGTEY